MRGLKLLVGGMGVLIIIGSTVVVGTVIHRLYARFSGPSTPPPASAAAPPPGNVGMALPSNAVAQAPAVAVSGLEPGEHISGIAAAGPDVAVWINGPKGDRLLLLDPLTGKTRTALGTP